MKNILAKSQKAKAKGQKPKAKSQKPKAKFNNIRPLTNCTMTGEENLIKLVTMKMPYGKYKGTVLCDIPTYYLEWYYSKGFPKGQLGELLHTLYEINTNGLEYLLKPIKQKYYE